MKWMKWKTFAITNIVCLLPIIPGVLLWNKLPDTMAIHFDIYNQPNGFASKAFVVFGLPIMMVLLHGNKMDYPCYVSDFASCNVRLWFRMESGYPENCHADCWRHIFGCRELSTEI